MALPPVCASCGVVMRCGRNDQPVRDSRMGSLPATVWVGDRFDCPSCEASIVTGFGQKRIETACPPELVEGAIEFRYE